MQDVSSSRCCYSWFEFPYHSLGLASIHPNDLVMAAFYDGHIRQYCSGMFDHQICRLCHESWLPHSLEFSMTVLNHEQYAYWVLTELNPMPFRRVFCHLERQFNQLVATESYLLDWYHRKFPSVQTCVLKGCQLALLCLYSIYQSHHHCRNWYSF